MGFGIKDGTPDEKVEAVKAALLQLPTKISQIVGYDIGQDLLLEGGQNHPAGKNRTLVWQADFKSSEDYQIYEKHEDHLAFINDYLKPILEPGTRAAIQYKTT